MTLSDEHRTHIHHIFYALCQERKWSLGFPTQFEWDYLPADNQVVQARITFDNQRPKIEIHPVAFQRGKTLVKGLVHHELCHFILGPEAGHGPRFRALEESWDGWWLYKSESLEFARHLNRVKGRYVLSCGWCGLRIVRNRVKHGSVCRSCCEKHANGNYDERFTLHIGGADMKEP